MRKPVKASKGQSGLLLGLGELLTQSRLHLKMTQDDVASRAGLSRVSYRAIETGTAAPRVDTLVNIARALGLEVKLIPKDMIPAVEAMLRSGSQDQAAFTADPEE